LGAGGRASSRDGYRAAAGAGRRAYAPPPVYTNDGYTNDVHTNDVLAHAIYANVV